LSRPEWMEDTSLRHRLINAFETVARGKHEFKRRVADAMSYLVPISENDFPTELRLHARTVLAIRDEFRQQAGDYVFYSYGDMRPKQRDEWVGALMKLYDAVRHDQGRIAERDCLNAKANQPT
jgi:hypothetical protein